MFAKSHLVVCLPVGPLHPPPYLCGEPLHPLGQDELLGGADPGGGLGTHHGGDPPAGGGGQPAGRLLEK